jgi:hypothetical protein
VHGRTFAVGFVEGFTSEVNSRLQSARRSAVAAAEAAQDEERWRAARSAMDSAVQLEPPASSVALVLVAKTQRVDQEFKVRHPSTRTVHSRLRLQSWSGYGPGREAGRRASLARHSVGGTVPSLSA